MEGIRTLEFSAENANEVPKKSNYINKNFDWASIGIPKKYWNISLDDCSNSITDLVRDFVLGKTNKKVLVIEGPNGTGKTRTVSAAFTERLLSGLAAGKYISCKYTVCPMVRSSRSFSAKVNEIDLLNRFYNEPFLVLDEAGKGDDQCLEKVFDSNVISARYDNELPTVICTNETMGELCTYLGYDIEDRFRETALVLTLDGESWRTK